MASRGRKIEIKEKREKRARFVRMFADTNDQGCATLDSFHLC